jgi:hypothetical protein
MRKSLIVLAVLTGRDPAVLPGVPSSRYSPGKPLSLYDPERSLTIPRPQAQTRPTQRGAGP